ncbi:MAG: gamma-butyrobetaine hydroxylase-like domain-containing protein, partial [Giesbergeria sp.]
RLPFELLRVYSPSAEVMGHAPGQEVLQTGKRNVDITGIEPVGNYAVKLQFSDGHDSGIFSWDYLYALGAHQEARWADYLRRLEAAGADRDTPMPGRKAAHSHGSGCGSGGGCG